MAPARWRLRQQAQVADFNRRAGGLEVTADELAVLLAQVSRSEAADVTP